MFCGRCGNNLNQNEKFCGRCGAKSSTSNQQNDGVRYPNRVKKYKVVFKKRTIFILSIISLFFISIPFISKMVEYLNNPSIVVEKFENAINNRDINEIKKYLICEEQEIIINDDLIQNYLDNIIQDSDRMSKNIGIWNKQIESNVINSTYSENILNGIDIIPDFSLVKTGVNMFGINEYKFEVIPVYIEFYSNESGADVYVNDTKLNQITEAYVDIKVGPVFPGKYTVKLQLDNHTVTRDLIVSNDIWHKGSSIVEFDTRYISLYSNIEYAFVLLDDGPTDFIVNSDDSFGPFTEMNQLKAEARFGNKVLTLPNQVVQDNYALYFDFTKSPELNTWLVESLNDFSIQLQEALNAYDSMLLDNISAEVMESFQYYFDCYKDYYENSLIYAIPSMRIGDIMELTGEDNTDLFISVYFSLDMFVNDVQPAIEGDQYEVSGWVDLEYDPLKSDLIITDIFLSPDGYFEGSRITRNLY